MQQRDMGASPPHTPMPLGEGGQYALLICGIYLLGGLLWGSSGGGVCHLYLVRAEDRSVVTTEGVGLGPCKVIVVGGQRRN